MSTAATPSFANSAMSGTTAGRRPKKSFGLARQRLGVGRHRVAGGDQLKVGQTVAVQLGQSEQMSMAHTATADDGEWNALHWVGSP